ncbi:2c460f22-e327-4aeb-8df0-a66f04557977 [Sclerotinia trifoliorum]|uniref:2c460f22-e327-4aeb-8df0-a66f04557977 n=1 Tax=Sclerotinia trifoliorum TaxID=28548 RepID=A0A8H2VX73_9HELO|nr:2c460f22-e327-4aeb-8df0-a66f04557977 [Sclerotinia trifoliorum]
MAPFTYLASLKAEAKWQDSLKQMKHRILRLGISRDELVNRLYEIRCSVDKVEKVLAELKETSWRISRMKFSLRKCWARVNEL